MSILIFFFVYFISNAGAPQKPRFSAEFRSVPGNYLPASVFHTHDGFTLGDCHLILFVHYNNDIYAPSACKYN